MPTWPASLPSSPLSGSFGVAPESNRAEFKPDQGGSPLRRKRWTTKRRLYSFTMILTTTQMETLEAFYSYDLGDGSLQFTFNDPITGNPMTFEFVEDPQYEHVQLDKWRVSMQVARMYTAPVAIFSSSGSATMTTTGTTV